MCLTLVQDSQPWRIAPRNELRRSRGELRMADRSSIEWTEATWNPTTGCDKVSPGCDNCYALTLAKRLKLMGQAKYQNDGSDRTSGPGFQLTVHPETLSIPFRWPSPRTIFVNSMSDLFHEDVPLAYMREVFDVMAATPHHTYQVLTKRTRRLVEMAERLEWTSNIWIGTSIESDRYAFRARQLAEVPAAVRFLSLEPLLGPIRKVPLDGVEWVIAGGESGPGARPVDPTWVRGIRDRCVETGVPFFFKQWGGRTPKSNGRLLDGRTWDEMPSARASAER